MKKTSRLFFWIIALALIIHGLILLFLFGAKYISHKKDLSKKTKAPIKIEKIQEPITKELEPIPYELPNMMPGHQPNADSEIKEPDKPEPDQAKEESQIISQDHQPKFRSKRKTTPKPTFNFDAINQYSIATGNSAFKNRGVNREPTKEDLTILMYQERVRKHFTNSVNQYANATYFYNIHQAELYLILIIGRNGKVLDIKIQNFSNNPAIPKLLEKIIVYAGLFPAMPATIKLETFALKTGIKIDQGKLTSGYNWV